MARALTTDMQTGLIAGTIRPFFLLRLTLNGAIVYLWDGIGDLSWNSQTWLGNGWFNGFVDIPESLDSSSANVDLVLSGVPQALISLLLNSVNHASRGATWSGLFAADGSIIADPYLCFEGPISAPRIDDSNTQSVITISLVDELVDLNRPREARFNSASQKAIYPTDLFFDFVPSLADYHGYMGLKTKPVKTPPPPHRVSHTPPRITHPRPKK